MDLEKHIEVTCEQGNIDKTEFIKVQEQINEKNFMNMEDFDRLLKIGFPIGLELKRLKKTEDISEVREMVKDKQVSAADFVAIILSNVFYDRIIQMHPLKSCRE